MRYDSKNPDSIIKNSTYLIFLQALYACFYGISTRSYLHIILSNFHRALLSCKNNWDKSFSNSHLPFNYFGYCTCGKYHQYGPHGATGDAATSSNAAISG